MPTTDRPEWIGGSVKKCRPGTLSGRSTNKQLGAINFARLLSGLTPLALDNDTVAEAQAAAIMMTAKNAVNHYPPKSWPCWSQTGYDAAGMSNLYQGVRTETNADKIESYLDDWGNINYAVGHRRWFLYPYLTAIGLGGTATANVSYLFGQPFNDAAPNPEWVSWPAAGWFPSRLDPRGRWSLSSGDDGADFTDATVRVTFEKARVRGIRRAPGRAGTRQADPGLGDARHLAHQPGRQGEGDRLQHHHGRHPGADHRLRGEVLPQPLTGEDAGRLGTTSPEDPTTTTSHGACSMIRSVSHGWCRSGPTPGPPGHNELPHARSRRRSPHSPDGRR